MKPEHEMAAPKRILMTADTVGGVWNYAIELARALETQDTVVALATMGAPLSRSQRRQCARLNNLCVFESRFKLEWMAEPWDDVKRAGRWLLELEAHVHPDLVHLNGYAHAKFPWKAPKIVVAHSCVMSWWAAVRREPPPSDWSRYRGEVAQGLNAADMVIAPTRSMLMELGRHYQWRERGVVIPNARSRDAYSPGIKWPIILCCGRLWDEAKNLAMVQRAAPEFRWPVYAAGDKEHPDGGEVIPANVRLLGFLAPQVMARWMGLAAIFVAPARYEPFGLAVLEAALSGCALILGDIPSLRENWDHAALFVDPNNPEELVKAVNQLTSHPEQREELGRQAEIRAGEFSRERMLAGYLAAYSNARRMRRSVGAGDQNAAAVPGPEIATCK